MIPTAPIDTAELDAWIGRHVMGEKPIEVIVSHPSRMSAEALEAGATCESVERWPRYSTSLAEAWRVVEKMRADGWEFGLMWRRGGEVEACFTLPLYAAGVNTAYGQMEHESPATAICLAARAAKEAERG